jgi:hypothetical protein
MAKKYMSVFNNGEEDLYIKDSEAREGIDDIISSCFFEDVYIGAGSSASDAAIEANHHSAVRCGEPISVTCASNKVWVIVPSGISVDVCMSGLGVPNTEGTITISGKSYKTYGSSNSYTGTFNITLF